MATIGSITVAFSASLDEFETGIEEVSDLLDGLSESVDDISEKIEGSSKTIKVKTIVDAKQVDAAADKIENTSASVKVTASLDKPETVADEVKKATGKGKDNKVTFLADVKDVIAKSIEAGKSTAILKKTIIAPIVATTKGVSEAIEFGKQLTNAYSLSATSVSDFAKSLSSASTSANGLREGVVLAFGLKSAWDASSVSAAGASKSVKNIGGALAAIAGESQNQERLSDALSAGGAAFASAAVTATLYNGAMSLVNRSTENLDPKLKAAIRGLAGIALAAASAEGESRLAASAATLLKTALTSQASPLAAVVAFTKTYSEGMREVSATSTAAVDRQRALVRIQNVLSQVFATTKSSVTGFFTPLVTGFTRAREAGDGYAASLIRGLSGLANSIGIVRSAAQSLGNAFAPFIAGFTRATAAGGSYFAAFDRGITDQLLSISLFRNAMSGIGSVFKATGASQFFDPLIAGFTRARTAGDGFIAAIARGVNGQLQSSAAFRALQGAVEAAGKSIYDFSASIVGVNATTKIGRDTYSAFAATVRAVGPTFSEVSARLGVFKSSVSAAFQALPAGRVVVGALSDAFKSLTDRASGVATSLPTIGSALSSVGPLMSLAGVATGKFSHQLEELSVHAQSIEQMADRFDATTQEMEVLAFAAESARVGMGQLAKASQAFLANVSKVRIGQLNSESVIEAKFAFDRLKLSIDDLREAEPNSLMGEVADRLLDVPDAADRAAIAFDIFGKQAVNILPALRGLKEAKEDTDRLGLATSKIDFDRLISAEQSFDRVSGASKALSRTMLATFAPIQAGWNNLMADLKGGIVAAIGPIRTMMAAAFVPMQVFMEIIGRVINILLRMVGVVTTVIAAMTNAPAVAVAWSAIGEAIKELLAPFEMILSTAQAVASAFADSITPAIDEGASAFEKLAFAAQTLGTVIVMTGLASAVMQTFGIQAGKMALTFIKSMFSMKAAQAAFTAISTAIKFVTFDLIMLGSNFIKQIAVRSVTALAIGLQNFLGYVAGIIVGNAAVTVSSTATGYAMAAAWIIGTLGLAAIIVVILAVISNMDKLYSWFENFGANVGKLFTFNGLYDAASAVAEAIKNVFVGMITSIAGFLSGIWTNIKKAVMGVKGPEKIDAATSSVDKIVETRGANRAANAAIGDKSAMKPEDVKSLTSTVSNARNEMTSLSIEAAKFGEKGRKAFLAARADFDKLQQRLADGTIDPAKFEKESARVRKSLQENLRLADVLSPEQMQQSAEEMRKSVEDAMSQVREVARGQDLGSDMSTDRFFPTSDAIKQAAEGFSSQYESELMKIEQKLQSGGYGTGQGALKEAQKAKEQAQSDFNRNMGKIKADVSFASDIRKALEDAFLSPLEAYEKNLKKIMDNKSLSPEEKSRATAMEQKKMVEGTFGKTSGQSFREKEQMLAAATSSGAFAQAYGGDKAAGAARAAAERNKLNMDRRQAAGLDPTASQSLKAGTDSINDAFGVTGKTLNEIQSTLSPEQFAEYQEAIKKNAEKVKQSLGVEQTGAQKLAESRTKLDNALADGVIDQDEYNKAVKKNKDDLLSSLGIKKTPAQDFEDAVKRIKENAAELSPEELAKGMKEAKDNLLASLGIDKSPSQAAAESMKKLQEAFDKGQISTDEFAKGAQKAKDSLLQSLGIPLDPVIQLKTRMNDLQEAFSKGLITQEEFTRGQEEAKRSMLPGSEEESPVKKFKRDMDSIDKAVKEGLITEEEGGQRKKMIQAQLQEDMKPALDRLAPDRRKVEATDARSKGGVDTFFRILRGNDNPTLKAQLEIARNTRLLAEAAADPEAAPVIANMQGR